MEHREQDADTRRLYDLAFGKRPAEELYDLRKDPDQLSNVIDQPEYAAIRSQLSQHLTDRLRRPRIRALWVAAKRLTGLSTWVALRNTQISNRTCSRREQATEAVLAQFAALFIPLILLVPFISATNFRLCGQHGNHLGQKCRGNGSPGGAMAPAFMRGADVEYYVKWRRSEGRCVSGRRYLN